MIALVLAVQSAACGAIDLPAGTSIDLVLAAPVSSGTSAVGDRVDLRVARPVLAGDAVAIPADTAVVGEVIDARKKGMMGMTGRLAVRPLYLTLGTSTVRLAGDTRAQGTVPVGTVAGLAAASVVGVLYVFTGRSAVIPAGAAVTASLAKPLHLATPCAGIDRDQPESPATN